MANFKRFLTLFFIALLAANMWGADFSKTYNYADLGEILDGDYLDASSYWKVPETAGNTATISIPSSDLSNQPTSDVTITFNIATFGSGTNPSSSNTTITAVGTETSSTWSGSTVSSYPSSSTYVNGVMTLTKAATPTTLGGLTITIGVNSGVKIFRLKSVTVAYTYSSGPSYTITAVSNNNSWGTVSGTTTITASPAAGYRVVSGDEGYTVTSGTATVTNNGDNTFSVTPSSNCTVRINFEPIPTHTVTWSSNGDDSNTAEYAEGASIVFPDAADGCEDKTFVGWCATPVATTDVAPSFVTSATMPNHNVTYYAVFADNDGGGTKWVLTDLSAVTAGTYAIVNQTNHAFNGTVNGSGHGNCTEGTFSFTAGEATSAPEGTCEITIAAVTNGFSMYNASYGYLYAKAASSGNLDWHNTEPSYWDWYNSNWSYSTYHARLRSYNATTGGIRTYGADNGDGVIKLAKKVSTASNSGYTTSCVTPTEVTVTFDANGGTGTMTPQVMSYNTATTLTANTFTREGYTFQGWATTSDGAKVYNDAASVSLKKNTTLYAVWSKRSYTITLNSLEHGTLETSPASTAEYEATVTVTVTPESGYQFSSITVTNDNTSATIATTGSGATRTFTMPASNVTISAAVSVIPTYTVTWSKNGDESDKDSYYEGEAIVFPATADGCDGKVFVGWSDEPVAETDVAPTYTTSATMGTSNLTFYAVYAESSGGVGTEYKLVSTISAGKDYIFVTRNSTGSGYAISATFSSNQNTGTSVTIAESGSDKIVSGTPSNTIIWSATSGYKLQNKSTETYLKINGSNFALNASSSNVFWSEDYGLYGKSGSGSTYYYVKCSDGTFTAITNTSGSSSNRVWAYEKTGSSPSYSGYTTTCGAGISARNIGWITSSKGKTIKRVIPVSAKNFDDATTLVATCANSNFRLELGATDVPAGTTGLTTTLTVLYTPTVSIATEPNVEIVLTAGDKTRTITVSGRSVPDDFLLITKKSSTWYALPANMTGGANQYDGVEVSPNDATTPTAVAISPSTLIYNLAPVADSRYAENGNLVRLVGNSDKCLWSNKATTTGKENIQNNATLGESNGDNYEWDLRTTDGIHYFIENPHHPQYGEGRRLAYGTKFGMYEEETIFFIVQAGCSSQPGEVNVSPRRVDATFSWVSNTTEMHIDLYTNSGMTEGHLTATASSSPYVFSGLAETTDYWYKLTPDDDTDCAVTGTFKTSGPIIDIVEWQENGVVLFIDKGDINPLIVIDGQEEHGSITGGGNATELFFAKYFEGAGDMKLLSIFNGTKNDISLADYSIALKVCGNTANTFNGTIHTYNISALGTIRAGQEIIFFSKPLSGQSPYSCSTAFLDSVADLDAPTANPRWILCDGAKSYNGTKFRIFDFSGNDPLLLLKKNALSEKDTIDVIGARFAPPTTKDCRNSDWGWRGQCLNMDFKKSPSSVEFKKLYELSSHSPVTTADSTAVLAGFGINLSDSILGKDDIMASARCILFRNKSVKNGADAVLKNTSTFATFTADEWNGRTVCINTSMLAAAGVSDDGQGTCNSYQALGNMDYNQYYIDWTNIDPGKELSKFTSDPETKEYTIPIDNMRQYACLKLRFQLQKNDGSHDVLTEAAQQVPIVVKGTDVDTNDPLFSELVIDKGSGLPSYSHSLARCKDCDVVILGSAALTKGDDSDPKDVPEVRNIKVYPGGQLIVPAGTEYTIQSLALRRQEDEVARADIRGTLTFKAPAASPIVSRRATMSSKPAQTYLDIRIDPTNWHYFTLPYDVDISAIRFANEDETAIPALGSDYLLQWYDGAYRAEHKTGGWTNVAGDATLKKGLGYIIALPGSGKVKRELRFPMSNDVIDEESGDKTVSYVYGYGADDPELRPNHKGWNLVGNPYFMDYSSDIVNPLRTGYLIEDHSTDPWDGKWTDNGDGVRYIVEPINNGWDGYRQVTMEDYPMKPFTCYFVQIGATAPATSSTEQSIVFNHTTYRPTPAPMRFESDEVDNHPVWFGLILTNPTDESDKTTLLISDQFTDDYDMMNDLVKMRGTYYQYPQITTAPILASHNNSEELAFNALPDESAATIGVPLNYYAATAGTYTFSVNERYSLEEVKSAMLYDATTTEYYDLLSNSEPYQFTTAKGDNKTRFKLFVRVERKVPQITTGLENAGKGGNEINGPRKILRDGHLFILRGGNVYDVTGKEVNK